MGRGDGKQALMIAETDFLVILNKKSGAVEGWCDDWDVLAGMLQPQTVATLSAFRVGPVYRPFELSDLASVSESEAAFRAHLNCAQRPA